MFGSFGVRIEMDSQIFWTFCNDRNKMSKYGCPEPKAHGATERIRRSDRAGSSDVLLLATWLRSDLHARAHGLDGNFQSQPLQRLRRQARGLYRRFGALLR